MVESSSSESKRGRMKLIIYPTEREGKGAKSARSFDALPLISKRWELCDSILLNRSRLTTEEHAPVTLAF